MEKPQLIQQVVNWLRKGYPNGIPTKDYVPLFAVLARRLSDSDIDDIVKSLEELAMQNDDQDRPDTVDAGAEVIRKIDQLPSDADIEKIKEVLFKEGVQLKDYEMELSPETDRDNK